MFNQHQLHETNVLIHDYLVRRTLLVAQKYSDPDMDETIYDSRIDELKILLEELKGNKCDIIHMFTNKEHPVAVLNI